MYTFPCLRRETHGAVGRSPGPSWANPRPLTSPNLWWNNSLMWHAAWHKTHSHPWCWMAPLYCKDNLSERISSLRRRKRGDRRSRGQRLALRNRKSDEQVSPSLLLRGMTTLTRKQPRICLSSVKLLNPQRTTPSETAFRAIHRHKGPRSGLC